MYFKSIFVSIQWRISSSLNCQHGERLPSMRPTDPAGRPSASHRQSKGRGGCGYTVGRRSISARCDHGFECEAGRSRSACSGAFFRFRRIPAVPPKSTAAPGPNRHRTGRNHGSLHRTDAVCKTAIAIPLRFHQWSQYGPGCTRTEAVQG